jgi:rhamnosyl/mannosyltransferase
MPQPVAELSALIARGNAPLVASYHADIFRQRSLLFMYRPLVLALLRSADAVITGSHAVKENSQLIRDSRVDPTVVGYGVDLASFGPERADPAAVAEIRAKYGEPHIVAVGRLVPYKGFDRLVSAAAALPCPVVIVGDGVSRPGLEAQIAAAGLGDRVHLVGRVDDDHLAAHLAAAALLVLPSWNHAEAFGIVLLEAQASGIPVIATDLGTGTAEAVIPGETGLMIPPEDVLALVEAVTTLIEDPERRERMGQAGRAFVSEHHSFDALASRLRPIYERLSARG